MLAAISSEASVLTLTVITVDRFVSIVYPLSLTKRTIRSAVVTMALVWLVAVTISLLPLLQTWRSSPSFYGSNGVCLPLHLHEPFPSGELDVNGSGS